MNQTRSRGKKKGIPYDAALPAPSEEINKGFKKSETRNL
jgi:hypothetical protein